MRVYACALENASEWTDDSVVPKGNLRYAATLSDFIIPSQFFPGLVDFVHSDLAGSPRMECKAVFTALSAHSNARL